MTDKEQIVSLKKRLRKKQKDYNSGFKQYQGLQKIFVQLRVCVRNCLWTAAGIPSNPGWSDGDVIDGLLQWRDITLELKRDLEYERTGQLVDLNKGEKE